MNADSSLLQYRVNENRLADYYISQNLHFNFFFLQFLKNYHCTIMYALLSSLEYVCGQKRALECGFASLQIFFMRAKFLKVFRSTQIVDSSGFLEMMAVI